MLHPFESALSLCERPFCCQDKCSKVVTACRISNPAYTREPAEGQRQAWRVRAGCSDHRRGRSISASSMPKCSRCGASSSTQQQTGGRQRQTRRLARRVKEWDQWVKETANGPWNWMNPDVMRRMMGGRREGQLVPDSDVERSEPLTEAQIAEWMAAQMPARIPSSRFNRFRRPPRDTWLRRFSFRVRAVAFDTRRNGSAPAHSRGGLRPRLQRAHARSRMGGRYRRYHRA